MASKYRSIPIPQGMVDLLDAHPLAVQHSRAYAAQCLIADGLGVERPPDPASRLSAAGTVGAERRYGEAEPAEAA